MGVRKVVLLLISIGFICLAGCGNRNTSVTESETDKEELRGTMNRPLQNRETLYFTPVISL